MVGLESQLKLKLMGPPEVRLGDKSLKFPTRKTLALLIYLALEGGEQPRDLLATLLWPESNQGRSYASLRNTLSHLQSSLSEAYELAQTSFLAVTHSALALNPDADIQLDLRTVEEAYALARAERSSRAPQQNLDSLPLLQEAAAYHRGDFLAGFSLGDAPTFDDWVDALREAVGRGANQDERRAQSGRVKHEDWAYRCADIARLVDDAVGTSTVAARRKTGS